MSYLGHTDAVFTQKAVLPPMCVYLSDAGTACAALQTQVVSCSTSRFDEQGMTELLLAPGKLGIPGISGTRNLRDNISDLKAQVWCHSAYI